jgi:hypothetical protein
VAQAGRERAVRWGVVLLASFGAHFLALSAVRLDAGMGTGTGWDSNVVDITFNTADSSPPVVPVEPAAAEPRAQAKPVVQVPVVATRRSRPTLEADETVPPRRTATSPAPSTSEPMIALDPKTAARAFMVSRQVAAGETSEAKPDGTKAAEARGRTYFEGIGDKQHLSVREPPKLRLHQDGTHHYRGHAFRAVVENDGSVTFDDGYAQGATVRFDITDAVMRRRGEDPYRVEKDWFLEGTEELRQELFDRWRAKQALVAIRKLRARLNRIAENDALSGSGKSALVIAMFRDTSDDEVGASARDAIAQFVAERMPRVELPVDSSAD